MLEWWEAVVFATCMARGHRKATTAVFRVAGSNLLGFCLWVLHITCTSVKTYVYIYMYGPDQVSPLQRAWEEVLTVRKSAGSRTVPHVL